LTTLLLLTATAGARTTSTQISVSPSAAPSTLARTLQSKNAIEAAASAYWLGLKGVAAVPAIPQLIAALGDNRPVKPATYRADVSDAARTTPGEEAAGALARIGKPAVDPLIMALRASSSAIARKNAAWALGQIDTLSHSPTSAAAPRPSPTQQD
jgi:HEAT repeat protein